MTPKRRPATKMSVEQATKLIDPYNNLLARDLPAGISVWSTADLPASKSRMQAAFRTYADSLMQRGGVTNTDLNSVIVTPYSYLAAFYPPKRAAQYKKEAQGGDTSVGGASPKLGDEIVVYMNERMRVHGTALAVEQPAPAPAPIQKSGGSGALKSLGILALIFAILNLFTYFSPEIFHSEEAARIKELKEELDLTPSTLPTQAQVDAANAKVAEYNQLIEGSAGKRYWLIPIPIPGRHAPASSR